MTLALVIAAIVGWTLNAFIFRACKIDGSWPLGLAVAIAVALVPGLLWLLIAGAATFVIAAHLWPPYHLVSERRRVADRLRQLAAAPGMDEVSAAQALDMVATEVLSRVPKGARCRCDELAPDEVAEHHLECSCGRWDRAQVAKERRPADHLKAENAGLGKVEDADLRASLTRVAESACHCGKCVGTKGASRVTVWTACRGMEVKHG